MYTVLLVYISRITEIQEPVKSFGKRERTDGSEYSNGGVTCKIKRWVYMPKRMTSCCFEVVKMYHYSVPLNCNKQDNMYQR